MISFESETGVSQSWVKFGRTTDGVTVACRAVDQPTIDVQHHTGLGAGEVFSWHIYAEHNRGPTSADDDDGRSRGATFDTYVHALHVMQSASDVNGVRTLSARTHLLAQARQQAFHAFPAYAHTPPHMYRPRTRLYSDGSTHMLRFLGASQPNL